ncbi:sigma 54-interacting transcriptional regulator [Neobacillus sp. MM2021_6]|nr:sigma 54-interacting transcriptional regulator [Neobacillus sp. MM2021_6]NHC18885.1 sigma-54 factor interaction domain-containing protein [Bacillus sp. MM2020_4]
MVKLMNLVNEGIIVLDDRGTLNEMNVKAESLLAVENKTVPQHIQQILQEFVWNEGVMNQTVTLATSRGERSLFLTKQKLSTNGQRNMEYLISLQDVNEMQSLAEMATEDQRKPFDQIIGVSSQIEEVKNYAFKVSQSDSTILIQGESGTGKEEFARAIHFSSPRREHPFITVNCGAIPENLLESELFGYDRGAFTGANSKGKLGKFELAQKGTIFLDEIGEMPSPLLFVQLVHLLPIY